MKRLIIGALSFLLIYTATDRSVSAETVNSVLQSQQINVSGTSTYSFTPFELVNFAYRGELRQQGIPGYGQLISDYYLGKVSARSLVKAAVTAGRVLPDTLENQRYVSAVATQLTLLNRS
jgi:hypothetical protein